MGALILKPTEAHSWLTDEHAADYMGYETTYFQQYIASISTFPRPRYVAGKSRRWNMLELSEWMDNQPTSKPSVTVAARRPRKVNLNAPLTQ